MVIHLFLLLMIMILPLVMRKSSQPRTRERFDGFTFSPAAKHTNRPSLMLRFALKAQRKSQFIKKDRAEFFFSKMSICKHSVHRRRHFGRSNVRGFYVWWSLKKKGRNMASFAMVETKLSFPFCAKTIFFIKRGF